MWQGTLACKTTCRIVQAVTDKRLALCTMLRRIYFGYHLSSVNSHLGKISSAPCCSTHQRDRLLDGVQAGLLDGASVSLQTVHGYEIYPLVIRLPENVIRTINRPERGKPQRPRRQRQTSGPAGDHVLFIRPSHPRETKYMLSLLSPATTIARICPMPATRSSRRPPLTRC